MNGALFIPQQFTIKLDSFQEAPFSASLELNFYDVVCCLRNRSFTPGTVIHDEWTGQDHTVLEDENQKLYLDPPLERMVNLERSLRNTADRRKRARKAAWKSET